MATTEAALAASPPVTGRRTIFYPCFALAVGATAFTGFFFTYFGPLFAGVYPELSPAVHVHGWSFFLWYLLFPAQAILLASGRASWHMALGRLSLVLAAVMVLTGLLVLAIRLEEALRGEGDAFSALLIRIGPLILSSLMLFALFYGAAIAMALKDRMEVHKRLMVLASSVGLGAALFRIFIALFGPVAWANAGWALATNLFILAGMVHDKTSRGAVHPVYWVGLGLALSIELLLWPFAGNPMIGAVNSAVASLAPRVAFLY